MLCVMGSELCVTPSRMRKWCMEQVRSSSQRTGTSWSSRRVSLAAPSLACRPTQTRFSSSRAPSPRTLAMMPTTRSSSSRRQLLRARPWAWTSTRESPWTPNRLGCGTTGASSARCSTRALSSPSSSCWWMKSSARASRSRSLGPAQTRRTLDRCLTHLPPATPTALSPWQRHAHGRAVEGCLREGLVSPCAGSGTRCGPAPGGACRVTRISGRTQP
mmetsp:Transcript_7873/g.21476  ORF Transcript_7873/g.21476 Transcript_7873/m.21476 type:complete len:217 (-) Transcript_7873:276-926(-)